MPKITIIGAGSSVFARRLVTDILTWPSLQNSTIALMDIDSEKLDIMTALTRRMIDQAGVGARVESSIDLKKALVETDYVAVAIRVGQGYPHIEIPLKYGVDQSIGDTLGPGGIFYFLSNAPAVVNIAAVMEEVCPEALMLNYTNPMAMLSSAVHEMTGIRYVGLCHSVQGTAMDLARYIGAPFEEVSYYVAGINHMAWFLKFQWKGQDAYPLLWEAMKNADIYNRDIVRWEIMKHFGSFVTESSIHNSEYMPYFRRTPELINQHTHEKMWGVGKTYGMTFNERMVYIQKFLDSSSEKNKLLAYGDEEIDIEASQEYFSHILNALETNTPYVFNGNVPNTGLITNLPDGSVVEVPVMVDGCGLHPCHVGDLPPGLAALNRTNLNVQELAVKGFIDKNRQLIYQAVQLDPLTSSVLPLPEIRKMVDELFKAHEKHLSI